MMKYNKSHILLMFEFSNWKQKSNIMQFQHIFQLNISNNLIGQEYEIFVWQNYKFIRIVMAK